MNRFITQSVALAVCLSMLAPALAAAQDADEKLIASYQLTMANVRKAKAALDELSKMALDAPAKQDDESFDQMIRRMEQNPKFMGVLRGAGISARDFALTVTTVITVGMSMALTADTSAEVLPPYLRAHQKFMVQNEKELKPLLPAFFGESR